MLKAISVLAVVSALFIFVTYLWIAPVVIHHGYPDAALTNSIPLSYAAPERHYYPPEE